MWVLLLLFLPPPSSFLFRMCEGEDVDAAGAARSISGACSSRHGPGNKRKRKQPSSPASEPHVAVGPHTSNSWGHFGSSHFGSSHFGSSPSSGTCLLVVASRCANDPALWRQRCLWRRRCGDHLAHGGLPAAVNSRAGASRSECRATPGRDPSLSKSSRLAKAAWPT
jgi:hypothetical protein